MYKVQYKLYLLFFPSLTQRGSILGIKLSTDEAEEVRLTPGHVLNCPHIVVSDPGDVVECGIQVVSFDAMGGEESGSFPGVVARADGCGVVDSKFLCARLGVTRSLE